MDWWKHKEMCSVEEILLSCHMDSSFFLVISVQLTMTPRPPGPAITFFSVEYEHLWYAQFAPNRTTLSFWLESCKNWSTLGRYILRIANSGDDPWKQPTYQPCTGERNKPLTSRNHNCLWRSLCLCRLPPPYYDTPFCFSFYIWLSHFFAGLNMTYL